MEKSEFTTYSPKDTLCWKCTKCVGYCDWSAFGIPIEGWVADKTDISYLVKSCPEYNEDYRCGSSEDISKYLGISVKNYYRNQEAFKKRYIECKRKGLTSEEARTKTCPVCGKKFIDNYKTYCSVKCRNNRKKNY